MYISPLVSGSWQVSKAHSLGEHRLSWNPRGCSNWHATGWEKSQPWHQPTSDQGCGDRQHVRDLGMLQVDLQVSRLVRNAQEFLFPALRSREERVLLDHGGVDYLQDDQERLPKTYGLRHLFVRCWSAARPSAHRPGAGVEPPPAPPVPGGFPAVLQSPGAAARVLRLFQLC